MFLKDFGYERCKKSIFSKSKTHMKNPIDKKLYLVAYCTPLTAFGKNSKTERQVRFGNHAKKRVFNPYTAMQHEKMDFVVEISTFQKFL